MQDFFTKLLLIWTQPWTVKVVVGGFLIYLHIMYNTTYSVEAKSRMD